MIPATDAKILYSPYTWGLVAGKMCTIDAGAYFTIAFTGTPTTAPTLGFDVSALAAPLPRIAVRVDGGPWMEHRIAASIPVPIPAGRTWGTRVEVMVLATTETQPRWGGLSTQIRFIELAADVTITSRTVRARPGNMFAITDSLGEAVRVLALNGTDDVDRNDARFGWPNLLADALGMEFGAAAFGAVGLTKSGSGGVPRFADNIPYLWSGVPRDFTPGPTVVVALPGTNDAAATDTEATAETVRMLNEVIANTACPIVVAPGWLQRKAAPIQAGIAACADPQRVTFVDTTGWWSTADSSDNLHPYGYINLIDLVPRLAAKVNEALGAFVPSVVPPSPPPAFYVNRGGVPIPIR